jgi:hypothetical protein
MDIVFLKSRNTYLYLPHRFLFFFFFFFFKECFGFSGGFLVFTLFYVNVIFCIFLGDLCSKFYFFSSAFLENDINVGPRVY